MKCPKCGYSRALKEIAPEGQCPACGIFYAKISAPPKVSSGPALASMPMGAKSLFWILAGAVALGYFGYQRYAAKQDRSGDPMQIGLPNDYAGATYVAMEGGQPVFRLTPDTRARLDKFSAEKVVLFGTSWCTYCAAERKVFAERGIRYVELDVDRDPDAMQFMTKVLGVPGVPATVVGTRLVPGYNAAEFADAIKNL